VLPRQPHERHRRMGPDVLALSGATDGGGPASILVGGLYPFRQDGSGPGAGIFLSSPLPPSLYCHCSFPPFSSPPSFLS
jgi:hypothetical protein